MNIKRHIPNAITCCNLISGCFSIMFLTLNMPVKAAIMIFVAGLFDLLDGLVARLLHTTSPVGAQLDSLSDMVSFGVAPGFIMCYLMDCAADLPLITLAHIDILPCCAFLLPMFAAIRLARFNVYDVQTTSFHGIPTPGMALFMASLPLALSRVGHLNDGALSFWACLGITIFFAFMMVSRLNFFSFKMKTLKWKGNQVRWIFIIIAVVTFAVFQLVALPFIMMLYILMSIFFGKTTEE